MAGRAGVYRMPRSVPDRRRFLSVCTGGLTAIIGGLIFAPAVAFVIGPLRRRRGAVPGADEFADAGPVNAIPAGTWTLIPIEIVRQDGWAKTQQSRSVWVRVKSTAPGDVQVLSPICPHLGCPVGWSSANSQFRCPCHGGVYTADGVWVSGPPPRGMDSLESQVRDGQLWVRWQDFRIGTSERVVVEL